MGAGVLTEAEKKQQAADESKQKQKESTEYAAGIATFRPSKEWLGEYGFDWIRAEKDVFDETLETKSFHWENSTLFVMDCSLQKKKTKEDYNKWKKEHSLESWKKKQRVEQTALKAKEKKYNALMAKNNWTEDFLLVKENEAYKFDLPDFNECSCYKNDRDFNQERMQAINENDEASIQSYYEDYLRESYMMEFDDDNKYLDREAYKKDNSGESIPETNADRKISPSDDHVFEYCYTPDNVQEVVYKSCGDGLWKRDKIVYKNCGNGDEAAKKITNNNPPDGTLNAYIDLDGSVLSCIKENQKIKFPIYCEDDVNWTNEQKKEKIYYFDVSPSGKTKHGDMYYFRNRDREKAETIVKSIIKEEYVYKGFALPGAGFYSLKNLSRVVVEDPESFSFFKALEPIFHYKKICFSRYGTSYELTYRKINDIQILRAKVNESIGLYVNGELNEVKYNNQWITKKEVESIPDYVVPVDKDEKCSGSLDSKVITFHLVEDKLSYLDNNWVTNKNKTIDVLSKEDSLKNLTVTIVNPQKLFFQEASSNREKLQNEQDYKDYYNINGLKFEVCLWDEVYKNTFKRQRITFSRDATEGKDFYFFSHLSASLWPEIENQRNENEKSIKGRKTIKLRNDLEAPELNDVNKPNEYEIQLFYEDRERTCHKLRLESNCPMVTIKPDGESDFKDTVFADPSEQQSITLKVEPCKECKDIICTSFFGKPKDPLRYYEPKIKVYSLTKNDFDLNKTKFGTFAGQMNVHLHPLYEYPILVVRVNKKDMSQGFLDGLKENIHALRNTLMQVGIKPVVKILDIKISGVVDWTKKVKETKETYMKCMDELKKLLNTNKNQVNKQKTLYDYLHQIVVVFAFNGSFSNNLNAYYKATPYEYDGKKHKVIYIGNNVEMQRGKPHILAHEVLHALKHPHVFQLVGVIEDIDENKEIIFTNRFCFPIAHTSNVMDYYNCNYSLHLYQWEKIRNNAYSTCLLYQTMDAELKKEFNS